MNVHLERQYHRDSVHVYMPTTSLRPAVPTIIRRASSDRIRAERSTHVEKSVRVLSDITLVVLYATLVFLPPVQHWRSSKAARRRFGRALCGVSDQPRAGGRLKQWQLNFNSSDACSNLCYSATEVGLGLVLRQGKMFDPQNVQGCAGFWS